MTPVNRFSCWITAAGLSAVMLTSFPAHAQTKPAPPAKPATSTAQPRPEPIGVRGVITLGQFQAQAADSFEAVLGSNTGLIFGGGAQVLLRLGFYVEASASRFKQTGERVFVGPGDEVFRLGIPLEVTLTPLEITGGWRYRHCPRSTRVRTTACRPRLIPYGGGGFSSYSYRETSELADPDEEIDERFNGFHIVGGAEYLAFPWMAIGGEVAWSSVPDALGEGGVSAAFNESNLGGTSLRLKVSIGR
jgi:hypothetical protein